MRRSHLTLALLMSLFGLAGMGLSTSNAQPEILPSPPKEVAQTPKKDAEPEPKAVKEDVKKEEPKVKEEAKKEGPKGEPKVEAKEEPKAESKVEPGKEEKGSFYTVAAEPEAEKADKKAFDDFKKSIEPALVKGDTAWMLTSSALVMLMVPGLALFYAGMVRKKNVLATMMQSMAALAVVGIYWVAVGYGLAFGPSQLKVPALFGFDSGGFVGWSNKLFFLKGVEASEVLPGLNISVYAHCMFQGMFAIITPALISGAIAERIRFWPFCIFMILWVTLVYCPLAHMVWAFDWFYDVSAGSVGADGSLPAIGLTAVGFLGKNGVLDFAGGTVVHIAAGVAGLACALVLRRRKGYPEHTVHPNSMVLTLLGAGLLWFGWFGFNGGSAVASGTWATSAFAATQAAAAAAGLSWVLTEWLLKGKPTALGLASGIVAGLVAVTPASGFVYIWGGLAIGLIAGVVCYLAVLLKGVLGYDDSLDAFGVHGVGGFLGAILTGVFSYTAISGIADTDGYFATKSALAAPAAIEAEVKTLNAGLPKEKEAIASAEKALADFEKKNPTPPSDAAAKKSYESDLTDLKTAVEKAKVLFRASLTSIAKKAGKDAIAGPYYKDLDEAVAELKKAKEKADADLVAKKEELAKAKVSPEDADKALKEPREAATAATTAFDGENGYLGGLDVAEADRELTKAQELEKKYKEAERTPMTQLGKQLKGALFSAVFAFVLSLILAFAVQAMTLGNFRTSEKDEDTGLDQTEHGETGFDFSNAYDAVPTTVGTEPKAAKVPPGQKRFEVVLEGIDNGELMKAWSALCQPSEQPLDPDFKMIYPYVTTVSGNRFRLRGGDPAKLSSSIQKLFTKKLGKQLKARVEE